MDAMHQHLEHVITRYYCIGGTVFFGLLWLAAEIINAYWNRKKKQEFKDTLNNFLK